MAKVCIERKAAGMTNTARRDVKPGVVFSLAMRDGKAGKKLYGALGNNGNFFSLNLGNGALASTANGTKRVIPVGTFTISAQYGTRRATTRGKVASGEIFQVKGGEKTYLALGTLSDGRLCSINMADPLNEDYAVTGNRTSNVTVIGHAKFNAVVAG